MFIDFNFNHESQLWNLAFIEELSLMFEDIILQEQLQPSAAA